MTFIRQKPDLEGIVRNLIALDLAHITPEEFTAYELELSAIASLNEALETAALVLHTADPPLMWQRLYPLLSDAAALLSSQLSPLLDLNAERSFPITETLAAVYRYMRNRQMTDPAAAIAQMNNQLADADEIAIRIRSSVADELCQRYPPLAA